MKVNSRGIITIVVAALCLTACGNGDSNDNNGGGGRGGGGPTTTWTPPSPTPTLTLPPERATYQVPQASCRGDYNVPLVVTTDNEAEAAYINKIDACTTRAQDSIYLQNNSDAVWVLHHTGSRSGTVAPWQDDDAMSMFRTIVTSGQTLLVPGGAVTVNLPPSEVVWNLNLPLTVGWVGYGVVRQRISTLFQTAWTNAIKSSHPAGAALVACTAAVTTYANSVNGLADKQLSVIVMDVLGDTIAVNNCRKELKLVRVRYADSGRVVALSEDIATIGKQTEFLEGIERSLKFAKQANRFSELAVYFLTHH
jgi:hypothetical protein